MQVFPSLYVSWFLCSLSHVCASSLLLLFPTSSPPFPLLPSTPSFPSQDLFKFKVDSVVELNLGANSKVPTKRLQWNTFGGISCDVLCHHTSVMHAVLIAGSDGKDWHHQQKPVQQPDFTVTLSPMEIRSFQVVIKT